MTTTLDNRALVTLYGGSGFIGRNVVRAIARTGARMRVAVRRPELALHLQPLGGVGQINVVQANVRERDLGGFVAEAQERVQREVALPAGYRVTWGGQFENQQRAMKRLAIIVPLTIALIFLLLFSSFGSLRQATLIILNVPFALIGGIVALFVSRQYLSVPASVGFIALFGVAVLNGVVLVSYINQLRREHGGERAILRRFDSQGMDARLFGGVAHAVEQHRLADPAQADHEDALRRLAEARPLERDPHGLHQLVTPGECRRRRSGSGGERVGDGIHGPEL